MSKKIVTFDATFGEADPASMIGKVIHVYNTFAGALAQTASDLAQVYSVNLLTGAVGSVAITQTKATASVAAVGATVDEHGCLVVGLKDDADEYWLQCANAGKWGVPKRIVVCRQDDMSSSSTQASVSSVSSSSSSSSST